MTLVTLGCTLVHIAMSVSAAGDAVYSPWVLRLKDHENAQEETTAG